jgi:type VII secretion-associated serine protease mycosin
VTRCSRRLAAAAAGLAAACALALPAAAAHAAVSSYTPSSNEWWMAQWSVPQKVWPQTQGAGVTVGVVDSGVQANLPDLRGVVLPGGDMLGDSGNGERDYAPNDGHGTAVAVLIASQGTGTGIVGIAPQAKILPVHSLYPGTSDTAPIAQGIKYAVDHGAKVINVSIGTPVESATSCEPAEQDAVAYALAHNVVVVAASGDTNRGATAGTEPATCAGVLAVGAVEPNGSLWPESTQGSNVSVAAPGDQITGEGADGRHSTNASGTSFAAPLVSGAAALIRSKYPSMPWYTVVQRLIGTAIADGSVPNNGTGYGIIDVSRAVNASQYPVSASAPNPVYASYQTWLKTPDGQAFAQANGISTGQSGSGTSGGQAAPSATATSSGGSNTLLIVLIVILVVAIGGGLALVQITRNRIRRGPRGPRGPGGGGGGGYPPGGYGPPPGQQYPQGQQYPPGR